MSALKESIECVKLKRSGNMTQSEIALGSSHSESAFRERTNELLLGESNQVKTIAQEASLEQNSLSDENKTRSSEKSGRSIENCVNINTASTHRSSESFSKASITISNSNPKKSR